MRKSPLKNLALILFALFLGYLGWITWQDVTESVQVRIQRSTLVLIAKPKGGSANDWVVDSIQKGAPSFNSPFSIGSTIERHLTVGGKQPDSMVVCIGRALFSRSLEIQAMYPIYDGKLADGDLSLSELSTQCAK